MQCKDGITVGLSRHLKLTHKKEWAEYEDIVAKRHEERAKKSEKQQINTRALIVRTIGQGIDLYQSFYVARFFMVSINFLLPSLPSHQNSKLV